MTHNNSSTSNMNRVSFNHVSHFPSYLLLCIDLTTQISRLKNVENYVRVFH